jgi:hypothetical protein
MLTVRPGDLPFNIPEFNFGGCTNFGQCTQGDEPPITVARLVPRLVGCAFDSYYLNVNFDYIADTNGERIPQETSQSLIFQRGDVSGDGVVNIIDAMFGAQHIVGLRENIHSLNMASVRYDAGGDIESIVDCMFIAQYVVGIRNCYFDLIQ